MPQWLTFRRTSGRDLAAVRRPRKTIRKAIALAMNKGELVEEAEARGIPTEGTKAELVGRLVDPAEPTDG
jgi:hypothetical protein